MQKRLSFLDTAKMLGIYLMIMGHCSTIKGIPYLYGAIYLFHMPLFFVISGYLFRSVEIKDSIKKYTKAYLLPYVTMSLMTLLVVLAISAWCQLSFLKETITLLKAMFWGHGVFGKALPAIGVGWFLCAMFQALFVYNVLSRFFDEKEKSIIVIMLFILGWTSAQAVWLPFSTQSAMCSMLYLFIGEMVRKHKVLDMEICHKIILMGGVITIIAMLYSGLSIASCRFEKPILSIPGSLISIYFVLVLSKKINLRWGEHTLLFMAGNQLVSYANYKYGVGHMFEQISVNPFLNYGIEFLFDLTITFMLAYLYVFFPWMNKNKKIILNS